MNQENKLKLKNCVEGLLKGAEELLSLAKEELAQVTEDLEKQSKEE